MLKPCFLVSSMDISFCRRVVGQPSSKTSYVVLGENAGPSKLAAIKKHNLPTINEDEFLNLIGTRVGPSGGGNMDEKMRKKMEKDDEVIKQGAKELEKREKRAAMSQEGRLVFTGSTLTGNDDSISLIVSRSWILPPNYGPFDTPPSHSRRSSVTRAKWKNCSSGYMIGRSLYQHPIT